MTEEGETTQSFPFKKFFQAMVILLLTTFMHYYINNGYNLNLEIEKCPFCYGMDFCPSFKNNEINFERLSYFEQISNLITAKNVFVANYNNRKVIIKKLGHKWELDNVDKIICEQVKNVTDEDCPPFDGWDVQDFTNDIVNFLSSTDDKTVLNLRICSSSAISKFINVVFASYSHLNTSVMTANIWTTLLANAEPLMLKILDAMDGWPVPKYHGACGRLIVEEYCGQNLNSVSEDSWFKRADIALQLLLAAEEFTYKHPFFRIYLTDISADNIAVTDDNKIKFIDWENVIIADKLLNYDDMRLHESKHFDCENCYAFSAEEICSHSISDHNFYSVCKLLLSENSPWPMMKNGLLHTTPKNVTDKYSTFLNLIEICAESSPSLNRFKSSKLLMKMLEEILADEELNVDKNQRHFEQSI